MAIVLTHHSYGKSRVRLTRVTRLQDHHELTELSVAIQLAGAFAASYTDGDNRSIVPTDTMKNRVYALAGEHAVANIEDFGMTLARGFLADFPHVSSATVRLEQQHWQRIVIDGQEHPHAFTGLGPEKRTCTVMFTRDRHQFEAGLDGLLLLKTTDSAFRGFVRDQYTTLPETDDRVLATMLTASWLYGETPGSFDEAYHAVRRALVETFARHKSLGVQQTLHAMGAAALEACSNLAEITLTMPNKHHLPVNLEPFGMKNRNEVFMPTDEPHGLISGTLRRSL